MANRLDFFFVWASRDPSCRPLWARAPSPRRTHSRALNRRVPTHPQLHATHPSPPHKPSRRPQGVAFTQLETVLGTKALEPGGNEVPLFCCQRHRSSRYRRTKAQAVAALVCSSTPWLPHCLTSLSPAFFSLCLPACLVTWLAFCISASLSTLPWPASIVSPPEISAWYLDGPTAGSHSFVIFPFRTP